MIRFIPIIILLATSAAAFSQHFTTSTVAGKKIIEPTSWNLIGLFQMSFKDWVEEMRFQNFYYGGKAGSYDYFASDSVDTQEAYQQIEKTDAFARITWTDLIKKRLILLELVAKLEPYKTKRIRIYPDRLKFNTNEEYKKAVQHFSNQEEYDYTINGITYTITIYRNEVYESAHIGVLWELNKNYKDKD